MPKITVDGIEIICDEGMFLIDAAKLGGVEIPALCYDKNLEVTSSCRMCLVEIEGSRKLQTSCSTIVKENMVVYTQTDRLKAIRRNILQLLLDSHPNDCLTCQKAGECLLQKYSYEYDVQFREHDGAMREKLVDESSPYIIRDDSKCILCGKCVRTCDVLEERKIMNFQNRGYDTRITLDLDQTFESSYCVSCNRCVSACPVGALLDRRMYKKVRPWECQVEEVQCRVCEYGCHFDVLSKDGKKVAVRAKEPANGRPLCLKGRLTTEVIHVDNPETPYKKIDGKFVKGSWANILGVDKVISRIEKMEDIDE